jgi:hypothetical protein
LARETARILDEIYESGHAVAVVRYGRIEAILAPLTDGPKVGLARAWQAKLPLLDEEVDMESLDLTDFDREMFDRIAMSSSGLWSPNETVEGRTISEVLVACSTLEMSGLIERFGASFQLTKSGKRVRGPTSDRSGLLL